MCSVAFYLLLPNPIAAASLLRWVLLLVRWRLLLLLLFLVPEEPPERSSDSVVQIVRLLLLGIWLLIVGGRLVLVLLLSLYGPEHLSQCAALPALGTIAALSAEQRAKYTRIGQRRHNVL